MRRKRRARDTAKKRYEQLEREFRQAEARLIEQMESEGVDGLRIDKRNLVPAETLYSSVNDMDALQEWVNEDPENRGGFLKFVKNGDRLNEEIRRRIDDGEPPPPGTSFYVKQYISDRAG